MNIKRAVGQRIKELRKRNNLTQEQLAERLNISQNAMSYIETGENFFSAETLEKLISELNVRAEEIFQFEHLRPEKDLLLEIVNMLNSRPDKIKDVYNITKALTL